MIPLDDERQKDDAFLNGVVADGFSLDEGQLLLAHFKENNGAIAADVLNGMGIYGPGDAKWLEVSLRSPRGILPSSMPGTV